MGTRALGASRRSWNAMVGLCLLVFASSLIANQTSSISGQVIDRKTRAPVAQALVILTCSCLLEARTTQTDANGEYQFDGLDEGTYMVQVLDDDADVKDTATLPPSTKLRLDFRIEPNGNLGDSSL